MKVWKPTDEEISKTKNWGTWSKEVSRFSWEYTEPETCFILEGEAEAMDNEGNKIKFKAGDMVAFEQGLECKWNITSDIKKRYKFG